MRWLIDEMLPANLASELAALGHDARSVHGTELAGASDETLYAVALDEHRVVVTENFADFALIVEQRHGRDEPCVPVVFIRKSAFPRRGALAFHLARHLDAWAMANRDPYPGLHWP